MKKALILASVASMIDQFNMNNIQLLLDAGYKIDVIANFEQGNTISEERIKLLKTKLNDLGIRVIHVPIPRKITDIKGIIKSYKIVRQYCDNEQYTLLHCHSPIGGVIARLAAKKSRKQGTKVIYTAHGFHFYKGAPLANWIMFYPIEKICSRWTDTLITINKEDYAFAKKHMNTKHIEYIPGVGIKTSKFYLEDFDVLKKKEELHLPSDSTVLLSVGELNDNKNQEIAIKAISKIANSNIYYLIAGKGYKDEYLKKLAEDLNVNLILLGYRTDIIELLNMADIYIFPSFREGLSVALMEAMASGLPCVVSKIRGNVDLIKEEQGGYLCDPSNEEEFRKSIISLLDENKRKKFSDFNIKRIKNFDVNKVNETMKDIYL